MFTLLFILMLIAATVAWFLIQRLQERPWLEQGVLAGTQDTGNIFSSAPRVGLWGFLAVVGSLFLLFTATYFMRMNAAHGGTAASDMLHAWMPVREPVLLWVNTGVLVVTSVVLELARRAMDRSNVSLARNGAAAAVVLTLVFLSGQAFAWQVVAGELQNLRSNAAFGFFILLTAVHGVHLLGGLFVLTRAVARLQGKFDASNLLAVTALRQTMQLCATYWHFLLLVWLGLFLLLLST